MKKINNKGFMLAEVVIVSTVMVTTLVGLYSGFSNTYKAYEVKMKYYDVDVIYALKNLENILIDNMLLNGYINNTSTNDYYKIEQGSDSDSVIYKFYETYNMNSVYLVKYDETTIKEGKFYNSITDDEFKEYLKFYVESIYDRNEDKSLTDAFESDVYKYVLIATTKDGTYGALRIK